MEEWRKGWHPEIIQAKGESESVLVVGAGPAGLEAARALGMRGYQVAIAEAKSDIGGRVSLEATLPGLSAWGRVVDYRRYQLSQMANVDIYHESELSAEQVLEFGFDNVAIATGSSWRADGFGRHHVTPMPNDGSIPIYTPDDLMAGNIPSGKVVVFDDDHYYMGGVLAQLLAENGAQTHLITSSAYVSDWTNNTLEQAAIHQKLASLDVQLQLNTAVSAITNKQITLSCAYTAKESVIQADAVVLVTSRAMHDELYQTLLAREQQWADAGIKSVKVFGDAQAPGPIAWATYAGHRYARELDAADIGDALPFKREVAQLCC